MSESPLVVIPALNEERSVGLVVERVRALGYPACVIDDGSADQTSAVARAAGAAVLRLPVNLGVGGAMRCGFRFAIQEGHRVVVQVDGDGQHDPGEIPDLLEVMSRTRADMVIGSRFLTPDRYAVHPGRRFVMNILARRASAAVGSQITDATSGFRAIRAPLLNFYADEYPVEYLGDTFEALISAARRGARIVEHPIRASHRQRGTSSAGFIASGWYVVRVLAAAMFVQSRTSPQPLNRSVPEDDLISRAIPAPD
jgi:glycosyltransferase involved in cell wall biosynthesis